MRNHSILIHLDVSVSMLQLQTFSVKSRHSFSFWRVIGRCVRGSGVRAVFVEYVYVDAAAADDSVSNEQWMLSPPREHGSYIVVQLQPIHILQSTA